jgi:hypothetical protein
MQSQRIGLLVEFTVGQATPINADGNCARRGSRDDFEAPLQRFQGWTTAYLASPAGVVTQGRIQLHERRRCREQADTPALDGIILVLCNMQ